MYGPSYRRSLPAAVPSGFSRSSFRLTNMAGRFRKLFPAFSRWTAEPFTVEFYEIVAVAESGGRSNLVDREIRFLQQNTGVFHAQLQQVLDGRGLELPAEFPQELIF